MYLIRITLRTSRINRVYIWKHEGRLLQPLPPNPVAPRSDWYRKMKGAWWAKPDLFEEGGY